MKIHIVQKGDTLWKIAKKYGVSFEELKMLNSQLSNPDMIMPGTKIKVPTTGGHVIKEAPIAGIKKEMPIQHPHVKEMPKAEHPFVKEKPKTLPIKEIPKKEMPKKEVPKKEKPYTPKMPTPIIPEIDINNYYSMNMTNVDVDVDIEEKPQPAPKPIVKEKPPKMHVEAPVQQEVCPPIIPYQPYCYDVSPMMPGSGFPPGVCPPEPIASEQIPIQYETLPGVAPTNYQPWQDESSSCNDVSYPSQYGEVAGAYNQNPYGIQPAPAYPEAGNIPQEYYQQPLVTYGQMPAENGHVISQQYKQESSDYIGTPSTPAAPFQMPYTAPAADDCGCGAPFTPQPGYAYPEQGFSPQMGAYPFPENYGAGAPQGQPGFNPQAGGYPFPENYGAGAPQGQPGFNPQMGGYPFPENYGAGAPQGQPGFNPQAGGYPFPENYGAGASQGQPGFNPQAGGYPFPENYGAGAPQGQPGFNPQAGGYPFPENYGAGIPQGPQGFRPELSVPQPFPGVFNPIHPFAPGAPAMMQSPYPPGSIGNTPVSGYPGEEEINQQNGHHIPQQIPGEVTPPILGPGGTAPVYMPPYNGNYAQPPLINPYGVDARTPFGMPYYQDDESSDYGN